MIPDALCQYLNDSGEKFVATHKLPPLASYTLILEVILAFASVQGKEFVEMAGTQSSDPP
jgi:hypothetical protein